MFHALTGAAPEAADLSFAGFGVPDDLAKLVLWMLSPDRSVRPKDGAAVLAALDEVQRAMWEDPTLVASPSSEVRTPAARERTAEGCGPTGTVIIPRASNSEA
jgi:hypothetical protein